MGIYTDAQKVKAAADYCRGQLGLRQVARRHGVNVASLRLWAAAYRAHGAVGVRTRQRKYYTAEFKLTVLQRMRSEMLSQRQAAALFGVRNRDMIGVWKRAYEVGGFAALRSYGRDRYSEMARQKDSLRAQDPEDETRSREQLLEEVQRLRMENAYLKKLKALAQREDQPAHEEEPKSCKS
jgi:transposase